MTNNTATTDQPDETPTVTLERTAQVAGKLLEDAHNAADDIVAQAFKERSRILSDAETEADQVRSQADEVREEINRLVEVHGDLASLLDNLAAQASAAAERHRAAVATAAGLSVLPNPATTVDEAGDDSAGGEDEAGAETPAEGE